MSRNQKVLAAVVAVLVVVACLAAVWVFVLHGGDAIRWRSDFHIDRLEELSELVTLRVQVSDVLCAEADGVRAAFLVAGDRSQGLLGGGGGGRLVGGIDDGFQRQGGNAGFAGQPKLHRAARDPAEVRHRLAAQPAARHRGAHNVAGIHD